MDFRRDWEVCLDAVRVPARCIDVELAEPLTDLTFAGYRSIHALVRLHSVPIGVVSLPLVDGRCTASALASAIVDRLSTALVRAAVRNVVDAPIAALPVDLEDLTGAPSHRTETLPGVTVAVCTRGRPDDLRACLESIRRLDHPDIEVIVVDNSGNDEVPGHEATQRVVDAFGSGIRSVREPTQGLDRARNRAIALATREIVAFTDDDVTVDPGWATAIARLFRASPETHAVTGLVMPLELETEAPLAFERYRGFGRGFERRWSADGEPGLHSIALRHGNTGRLGTGANMAFRRSALETLGGFDPALDVGTITHGGGDLDMFFRVIKAGGMLAYDPSAIVRHRHRRALHELHEQIANWGTAMRSYVERNRRLYPEERVPFTMLVHWLLGTWHLRRFMRSLFDRRFPTSLVVAEVRGLVTGRTRYDRAYASSEALIRAFGPTACPPHAASRSARGRGRSLREMVEREVDLAMPLAPLADVGGAASVLLRVTLGGRLVTTTIIANHGRPVGEARLGDIVAQSAGAAIVGRSPRVRPDSRATRQLATGMLAALQSRVSGHRAALRRSRAERRARARTS